MNTAPALTAAHAHADAQVHRLPTLRWVSVLVMLVAAYPLAAALDVTVPRPALLAVILALAAANLFTLSWLARRHAPAGATMLLGQLVVDLAAWGAFLYFTGGATNPLISMLLPLVAIGAAILPATQAWLLAAFAVGIYSLLWSHYQPIRLDDPALAMHWHLAGMWLTFALSAAVIVGFVVRMTATIRERDLALAAAGEAMARTGHIVALGNLAAGAAHNLGTPLGTMRIVADELLASKHLPADMRPDIELMSNQVEHCRKILSLLTAEAGNLRAEGGRVTDARTWVMETVAHWQSQRPHGHADVACDDTLASEKIVVDATLSQALHTLVNNAADASPGSVEVRAHTEDNCLVVEVADRGPGMPAQLLATVGTAPLTHRPAGMGIGLFLARNTLQRCHGSLEFANRPGGGTLARMRIPLEQIRA